MLCVIWGGSLLLLCGVVDGLFNVVGLDVIVVDADE